MYKLFVDLIKQFLWGIYAKKICNTHLQYLTPVTCLLDYYLKLYVLLKQKKKSSL